jgi:transcriptional regulator with XRE-family HTH domain
MTESIMHATDHEITSLFASMWDDDEVVFEAKAQDVAIALASAVETAGLTRAELAKKLDWKPSRVTKVLTGHSNLTLKTIFQVCHAIGLEFDVVLRKSNERAAVIDPVQHHALHQEAMTNLHKTRELLNAATLLHRKISVSALTARSFTREEARLRLVA